MPLSTKSGKIRTLTATEAPFVYFEQAPVFGISDGLARLTLAAERLYLRDGELEADLVAVAHLRMSFAAARRLRTALDSIELLIAKTTDKAN